MKWWSFTVVCCGEPESSKYQKVYTCKVFRIGLVLQFIAFFEKKKRNQNTPSSKLLEATVFMFSDTWHFMILWHWTVHLLCSLTKVLMHRLVICSWSSYIPAVLVESYKVFHSLCRGAFFLWRALILSWPRIMCSQVRMLKFLEPSREMP